LCASHPVDVPRANRAPTARRRHGPSDAGVRGPARLGRRTVFGGLSIEETAEALGISVRTVIWTGHWRAWLYRTLSTVHAD
jgi:hypothetical protein